MKKTVLASVLLTVAGLALLLPSSPFVRLLFITTTATTTVTAAGAFGGFGGGLAGAPAGFTTAASSSVESTVESLAGYGLIAAGVVLEILSMFLREGKKGGRSGASEGAS